jgi:hypothetical protein
MMFSFKGVFLGCSYRGGAPDSAVENDTFAVASAANGTHGASNFSAQGFNYALLSVSH